MATTGRGAIAAEVKPSYAGGLHRKRKQQSPKPPKGMPQGKPKGLTGRKGA